MDIFDKFITKTSPGKIEDSSSRKGNLGVHDSIEWLISSMSLQFYIKLPRVPLKLFFGESILAMTHTGENSFYCTFQCMMIRFYNEFKINWFIEKRAWPYKPGSKQCDLCACEKTFITMGDPGHTLNRRNEIFHKCRNRTKFLLKNFLPP